MPAMRNNQQVTDREYILSDHSAIITHTDENGRIVYVNDGFVEASGFDRDELIGQPHNIVRHPDMPPEAFRDMWDTLKLGQPWQGMIKNRRKDGDHYWANATVTPRAEGGYMSVRTPATRQQIEAAETLYRCMREDPRIKFRQGVAEFPGLTGIRARMRRRLRNWPLARKLAALVVVGCVLIGAVFAALVHGPEAQWGQVSCGCHPNCGVGTALMINKETKEWAPVPQFLNIPGLVKDMQKLTDAGRGRTFSNFMMALALLKNYKPLRAPKSLALVDLLKKFDKSFALTGEKRADKEYGASRPERTLDDTLKRRSDPWNFLFIAGMWFQDLFNYDFRRTEMCIIPYATQIGEISFCAYNTGIGWRNIIENMYKNATVAEWYKTHGKHEIYARGKEVELADKSHSLYVDSNDATHVREREHDIPMTAAEEERARRKAEWEAKQARAYYEEMVLKKKPESLVQIGSPSNANGNGNGHGKPVDETEKVSV